LPATLSWKATRILKSSTPHPTKTLRAIEASSQENENDSL
jgi:hypothetical protein